MKSLRICLLTLLLGLGLSFSSPAFSAEPSSKVNLDDINVQRDNDRLEQPPAEMAATVNAPGVDCPECRKNMTAGEHSPTPNIEPEGLAQGEGSKKPSKAQPQKQ